MPAENKSAAFVPLISSSIAGPLGVFHLPRLWNKVLLAAKGLLHEDYPALGTPFDQMVLETLGLSREEMESYLREKLPTYFEFEKWILQKNGGSLNQEAIERVNAAIMNATYDEHDRKVVLAVCGLEDDEAITDAVTLSNLADWEEFHRNLVSGYEESTQETIITGGCHCGAVRYRVSNPKWSYPMVCHCYSCRLVGGTPYLPSVYFPKESFAWIRGEPKYYYYIRWYTGGAIGWTQRGFCSKCGTQLTHMNNDGTPEEREKAVNVNIISLDNPNAFPPKGWTGGIGARLEWVPLPKEAVPQLIQELRNWDDEDGDTGKRHQSAIGALKQIGTPEAMKAVEEWEQNKNRP